MVRAPHAFDAAFLFSAFKAALTAAVQAIPLQEDAKNDHGQNSDRTGDK
jgi:ribulose 1,5-bisphosphate carboxylase large subunit-like protein